MTIPLREAPASRPPLLTLTAPVATDPSSQDMLPLDHLPALAPTPPAADTDEDERTCRRLAIAIAELLTGRRALSQVQAVLHPHLVAHVGHLVRSGAARGLRPASVRIQVDAARAEVAMRLSDAHASRAVALRFDLTAAMWLCTAVEAGLTAGPSRPSRGNA